MIPKASKSQFRTPFRGETINGGSPLSMSPCPELLLAATPCPALACSQMSTPGITIDAIKNLVRKSPSRKKNVRNNVIRQRTSKKGEQNKTGRIEAVLNPDQRQPPNTKNRVRVTSVHKAGDKGEDERKSYAGKAEDVLSATEVTNLKYVDLVLDENNKETLEKSTCLNSVDQGQIEEAQNNEKLVEQTSEKATGSETTKRPKYGRMKSEQKVQNVKITKAKNKLKKFFPSKLTKSRNVYSARDGDEVVFVGKDDYVYKEQYEDPSVTIPQGHPDVYVFSYTPPAETATSSRDIKGQVRLQVLKAIYKIENELTVLRHKRHMIKHKIEKNKGI